MSCAALDYVECDTKPMDGAVLVGSGWVVDEVGGGGDWGKPAGCKRSHEMGLTGEFCPLSGVVCPEMKLIGKPVVWKMGWTRSHLVFRSGLRVCHSVPPRSCPRNDLNYPSLSLSHPIPPTLSSFSSLLR